MNAPTANAATYQKHCPGCFQQKNGIAVCSQCGYDESAPRSPLFLPHGFVLGGQYRVGRVLGRPGGFGITYLGWDVNLQQRVAIKEYLPREIALRERSSLNVTVHTEDDRRGFDFGKEQFLREARIVARLDHPNIVRVRNFFNTNNTAYLVMDYYEGMSLGDYLSNVRNKLEPEMAVPLFKPILDGLHYVHQRGLVHRDLKPHNIYLAAIGRPIVLDFGAARQAAGDRVQSLSVVLTEGYAPLEQYQRRAVQGPWTDVYGVAATLYRTLTGSAPPIALDRIGRDPIEDHDWASIPTELVGAMRRALAVRPNDRYQNAAEFRAALDEFTAEEAHIPDGAANEPVMLPMLAEMTRSDLPSRVAEANTGARPTIIKPSTGYDFSATAETIAVAAKARFLPDDLWGSMDNPTIAPAAPQPNPEPIPQLLEDAPTIAVAQRPARSPELKPSSPAPIPPPLAAKPVQVSAPAPAPIPPQVFAPAPAPAAAQQVSAPQLARPIATDAGVAPLFDPPSRPLPNKDAPRTLTYAAPHPPLTVTVPSKKMPWKAVAVASVAVLALGYVLINPPGERQAPRAAAAPATSSTFAPTEEDISQVQVKPELILPTVVRIAGGTVSVPAAGAVAVAGFDAQVSEVTVAEFSAFVKATQYSNSRWQNYPCESTGGRLPTWENPGYGQKDGHPVVCVSAEDGIAFAEWLSRESGQKWRLPTEAEWQLAASGGRSSKFWWGDTVGEGQASCQDCPPKVPMQPSVIGTFPANPNGLNEVLGNVQEWTCSVDGQAGSCAVGENGTLPSQWVVRGGSWRQPADALSLRGRVVISPYSRNVWTGFRLIRVSGTN